MSFRKSFAYVAIFSIAYFMALVMIRFILSFCPTEADKVGAGVTASLILLLLIAMDKC